MPQPAKSEQQKRILEAATLVALMNNISVKTGHLNLEVEQAFNDWLFSSGLQEFIEWLKADEQKT